MEAAERLIISAYFTMWYSSVFFGIEVSNEHAWMVQELCTKSWAAVCSNRDEISPAIRAGNRCASIPEATVAEQICDAMAVHICN